MRQAFWFAWGLALCLLASGALAQGTKDTKPAKEPAPTASPAASPAPETAATVAQTQPAKVAKKAKKGKKAKRARRRARVQRAQPAPVAATAPVVSAEEHQRWQTLYDERLQKLTPAEREKLEAKRQRWHAIIQRSSSRL